MQYILILFSLISINLVYSFQSKMMMNLGDNNHQIIGNKFNRLLPEIEAKTILSQNNAYGVLSTLNRKSNLKGFPYGSLVGFSLTDNDKPFFIFSDLSLHTRNLIINNTASLYVNEYGFKMATDSRVSITGKLTTTNDCNNYYKNKYLKYHPNADWINLPDFKVYIMNEICDISFVGGFGKATKIRLKDYDSALVDPIIFEIDEYVDYINKNFYNLIYEYISNKLHYDIENYYIKNLDSQGLNIIYDNSNFIRIPFETKVYTIEDLKYALIKLLS